MTPDAIEAIEVRLLVEAIFARYGYDLRGYAAGPRRNRLRAVLRHSGESSFSALQHRVLHDADAFAELIPHFTVSVSEMFRDPGFFLAFRDAVVPVLRTYPHVRIWHAGCATGEEVYSMAILLAECGLLDRTEILATDLSTQALEQARAGMYPADRLATFARNHRAANGTGDLSRYHTAAYGGFAMSEPLRRNVTWLQHDLVSDGVFAEVQVVLCRNVLLYFGGELRDQVTTKLADSLCPGGFLCLGASERLDARQYAVGFEDFVAASRIYRYNR